MKKTLIVAMLLVASMCCHAQYQLPNPGFEEWDGTAVDAEPAHWNSFATSDGSYASLASTPHHYRRSGGRPGTTGSKYLTIYTKSIMGVKANGNMTTGRVHAGALSASSDENYNYTQRSNSAHCQPFSGTPDSMYVWVSYYASSSSSQAQIAAILHGDNDFRSPNHESNQSLYRAKAEARFSRSTSSASTMHWQQMKVPFVYDGNSSVAYVLLNMTTNANPGGGNANDSLSIDDIEFIYSAWLSSITVGGTPIADFDKGVMDYHMHVDNLEAEVTGITEVSDAVTAISRQTVDDTTVLVTIDVTAEDNVTMRHYTVTLTTGAPAVGITQPLGHSAAQLRLYPNPTADVVAVNAHGEVIVSDMQGRVVLRRHAHGLTRISLATLPAGTYIIRCGSATSKIVKN